MGWQPGTLLLAPLQQTKTLEFETFFLIISIFLNIKTKLEK